MTTRLLQMLLGGVLLTAFTACGPSDPGASALTQLASAGYSLSVADFHRAAATGDLPALQLFLQAGTFVDVPALEGNQEVTALRVAIRHGRDTAAALLLDHTASLTKADSDPAAPLLDLALRSGSEPLLRSLLALPPLPTTNLPSLLLLASRQGEVGLMEALLDHQPGLSLDACLLHAAAHGHLGMVDFLLQHQADPNALDPSTHQTPLMRAAHGGHRTVIDLLLSVGAARFFVDKDNHLAADHAHRAQFADIANRLWQPPTRFEQELGIPPPATPASPPTDWISATAPAIPLHPPTVLTPGQPRPLSPLHLAIVGHHSGLSTPPPARQRLQLHTVRPAQLPFHLISVITHHATLEEFTQPPRQHLLGVGDPVGDTGWTLREIRTAPAHPFPSWLTGLVIIQHSTTSHQLALLPGLPARHGPPTAVLHIDGTDEFYEGHPGDLFRFTRNPEVFKVLTLQPRRLQLEDAQGTFWLNLTPTTP